VAHASVGEPHAAVDEQRVSAIDEAEAIFSDFTETAERQDSHAFERTT
jgi:hypothetical protein